MQKASIIYQALVRIICKMSIAVRAAIVALERVAGTRWGAAAITGLRELLRSGLTRCDLNQLREAILATDGWSAASSKFAEIAELIS